MEIRPVKRRAGRKFMRGARTFFIYGMLVFSLLGGSSLRGAETDKGDSVRQASTSLREDINRLEARLGINPAREGAQEERIAALEYRMLGKTQSGSLVSRIERLKREERQKQAGMGAQGPAVVTSG